MSTRSSYPSQSAQASRSAQAMRSTSAQQYGPAQVPLPARPLARALLLALQSWPGITNDECATGWAGALRSVCTRPALIAVTGDGFGVTPPTNGSKTRPPVVVVAQYLQKHLVRELAAQQPTEVVSGYRGDTPVMSPASSYRRSAFRRQRLKLVCMACGSQAVRAHCRHGNVWGSGRILWCRWG